MSPVDEAAFLGYVFEESINGLNEQGLNEQGLNEQGLNEQGLNEQGLNEQGLNEQFRSSLYFAEELAAPLVIQ